MKNEVEKRFLRDRVLFIFKVTGKEQEMRDKFKEETSLSDKKIKRFLETGFTTERDARKIFCFYQRYYGAYLFLKKDYKNGFYGPLKPWCKNYNA
ncbi:hypothetical protein [Clostridium lundense]|uniref:hypothetical protein n=1 Tax=Clostridium lundense TaxID=319475 RepID=UPI000480BC56|nr:hypothetical protein [Clostridium lundense]